MFTIGIGIADARQVDLFADLVSSERPVPDFQGSLLCWVSLQYIGGGLEMACSRSSSRTPGAPVCSSAYAPPIGIIGAVVRSVSPHNRCTHLTQPGASCAASGARPQRSSTHAKRVRLEIKVATVKSLSSVVQG